MTTVLITHPDCLGHVNPPGAPEQVARLEYILRALEPLALDRLDAPMGTDEQIARCHTPDYIAKIREIMPTSGTVWLDGDTYASPGSLDAAYRAVGGAVRAVAGIRRPGPVAVPGLGAVTKSFLLAVMLYAAVAAAFTALAGPKTPQALALSATVFAGASQLATVQLIAEGALPAIVVLTALTINLRMMMYSASLAPYFQHLGNGWRFGLAYLLVDQNYALSVNRYQCIDAGFDPHGQWYYLGAGVALWLTWQTSTAIGVFLGAGIPRDWSLDFAVPLVFMVLLVPALRDRAHVVAALVGGVVATLGVVLPLKLGVVVGALCGIAAGYALERRDQAAATRGGS